MSPIESTGTKILNHLVSQGHFIDFDAAQQLVKISPTPKPKIVERILANEELLINFLAGLGSRPATSHSFVALSGESTDVIKGFGVCLSCGIPWSGHGEPPVKRWQFVDDPNDARLLVTAPLPFEPDVLEMV